MNNTHLKGLIAAPFTPFHKDGSINIKLIPAYYAMLKANGVKGAFINGSTGEGVSLTLDEKKKVAVAWADAAGNDKEFKIMTLVGGTCLADCRELAVHARNIGLYGVSFTAPFYFKPADADALAESCLHVASAVPDMPFYYYHIPVLNGTAIPMIDLLRKIDGRCPNFYGIKYTHEDFMDFSSCMQYRDSRYDMLWGRDENMLSALVLGNKASIGSTFNYAAPLYHQLISAFENNDLVKAQQLQQKAIDLIRLLGKYGGIATGKAYMKLTGLDCGEFRLPVKNMTDQQFIAFKNDVAGLGFSHYASSVPEMNKRPDN